MRHSNVDQYARESSFYYFDSRTKIIVSILFVIIVALLRDLLTLLIALIFILVTMSISNIPARHFFKRYLIAVPFILFASLAMLLSRNFQMFITMFIRITTCVLALILLSSATPFFDLLKGLQSLKVPNIFIILLMFTYRYFFVFVDELHRMKLARKARGFRGGKHLFDKRSMKIISYSIGMILIRAYQRGVRIYDALLVRGFDGKIKTLTSLKFTVLDSCFGLIFIFISGYLIYFDWFVII